MSDRIAFHAEVLARRRTAWSLERPFYTDPEIHALDLRVVHARHWLFAGHVAELPETGSWFLFGIGEESLIITRDGDGAIHALFNVCRHRGSRICLEPAGKARRLVCPYHQWVFAADGALVGAHGMPEGFDKAAFGLHRAQVEVCEGLIFVRFAEHGPAFAPMAADLKRHLAPHRLAEARIAHRTKHLVQANWKLIAENFRECYHCAGTHPEYCASVFGGAARKPPEAERRRLAFQDESQARWRSQGLPTDNVSFVPGSWHHIARTILAEGWRSWTLDGEPVAPLMGDLPDRGTGLLGAVMYPNFWLEGGCDYLTTTRVLPVSATSSSIEITWYVAPGAVAGRDYDLERMTEVWGRTAEQDMTLAADNQAGVNSTRYQPGPYSPQEAGDLEHFLAWYQRQWADAAAHDDAAACRAGG